MELFLEFMTSILGKIFDLSATSSAMASAMARFYAAIKARYQL